MIDFIPSTLAAARYPAKTRSVPIAIYSIVFAALCTSWGILWDIMWHISIGRDGLFSAPHVLMYIGAIVTGVVSGYQILSITFNKHHPARAVSIRFWGVFYGSLGAMFCVWGALAMLTSAPFDDWWHSAYGLDVEIISPPHALLAVGFLMLQFGCVVSVLALQNRATDLADKRPMSGSASFQIKQLFILSAGILLVQYYTLFYEKLIEINSHRSQYYILSGLLFPGFLMAIGRSARLKYAMTATTIAYLLVMLIPSWILQYVPATPKLGPVLNPITHYQPFHFPLLLIGPAYVLDRLFQRYGQRFNDWQLAGIAAVIFMTVFLLVQWPFGAFLHESPLARNHFFMSYSWRYSLPPDWPYRYKFDPAHQESAGRFALGLALALLGAFGSARVGLWIGNWMREIKR